MPAPNASGPCVAVVAGSDLFIVDSGTDSPRNLGRMGYPIGKVKAVFLTHFHSNHLDGLGELANLRWAAGANVKSLPVYGPEGVERVVDGFNRVYAQDFNYRHDHHGDTVAPMSGAGMTSHPFKTPAAGQLTVVYEGDDLKIEALKVNHHPVTPAVGYRFIYKDRSLLISGDTTKYATVEQFAQGVDLLVHEALAPNLVKVMGNTAQHLGNRVIQKIALDIVDYHTSPIEAAEIARDAQVGHLLYYHIVPPLVLPGQEALFLNGAEAVFPDYTVGRDGVAFSLPVNSDKIIKISHGL